MISDSAACETGQTTDACSRGRIDSGFNRNLVHLGIGNCTWHARHDSPDDRATVRSIIVALLCQNLADDRVIQIRSGLVRAIVEGGQYNRDRIQYFSDRLTLWYKSLPEAVAEAELEAQALVADFESIVEEIEDYASHFNQKKTK